MLRSETDSVDVLSFDDHREFLKAEIAKRKARRKSFSMRGLCRRAGLASPSLLTMILSGRRTMTEETAEKLAEVLLLVGRRRRYFIALGKLPVAKTDQERMEIRQHLLDLKSAIDESLLDVRQFKVLTEWYYSVIYVLIGMEDFSAEPEELSKLLGRGVTAPQVLQAFDDLLVLGLIEKKEGVYRQTHQALSTGEDVKGAAIYLYHRRMIAFAEEALSLPAQRREFNGLTFGIPREQLPVIKEKIRAFRRELNGYLAQFKKRSDVYQLNMHLFPLTEGMEGERSK